MEPYSEETLSQTELIEQTKLRTLAELEQASIQALRLSTETGRLLRETGFSKIGELLHPNALQRTQALKMPVKNRQEVLRQTKQAIQLWQKYFVRELTHSLQDLKQTAATLSPPITLIADDVYAALYPAHQKPHRLIRIEALDLSSRAYNALLRARITTVGQVMDLAEKYTLISAIGPKSAQEISKVLGRYLSNPMARALSERPLAELPAITQFAETSLLVLQLSVWVYSQFKSSQITTVGQLAALTDTQLQQLGRARHLAEQRLAEVKTTLAAYIRSHSDEQKGKPEATLAPCDVQDKVEEGETAVPLSQSTQSALQQREAQLRQDLARAQLIGDLPLTQAQFEAMCQLVQTEAISRLQVPQPQAVPAAMFVTLMVFTARFSSVEGRNFWTPYAQLVWGLPDAEPKLQNECRERFATAVQELTQAFPNLLPFTQSSDGDVVRPVYRHAILPAYLEEDFARWLQKGWPDILDIPADSLAEALQNDGRVANQPRPLVEFLQSEQTAKTAVALITQLADGIRQVQNGESAAIIGEQWPPHTILHNLWQAIRSSFANAASPATSIRMGRGRVEWVWDLQENEIVLRLRNLTLNAKPEKALWEEENQEQFLNPWQLEGGHWWIDELLLEQPQTAKGTLFVLGEAGEELTRLDVPPLPEQPWLLFQVQDEETAVLQTQINKSGWYCLSRRDGVTLRGAVIEHKAIPLPQLLKNEAHHQQARLCHLQLPVTVWQGDAPLAEWVADDAEEETSPYLEGNLLAGASPRMPKVYQDTAVRLIIPNPTTSGVTLWLKWGAEMRKVPLSATEAAVNLQPYLLPTPATYTIQLRQGLQPLLKEPLTFTTLPGVHISPPSPGRLYSRSVRPNCTLQGLTLENILPDPRYQTKCLPDGRIHLEWLDWRDEDGRLTLQFGEQRVQLGWPLPQRIFSWLEPTPRYGFARESDLAQTTIHVIAPNENKFPTGRAYKYFDVWIVGAEAGSRRIPFRKHRHLSRAIIQAGDPLHEMIHEYIRRHPGYLVRVQARLYKEEWTLLEVRPQPQISRAAIQYYPDQQAIQFHCDITTPWEGDILFALYDLHHPFAPPQTWQATQLEKEHALPFTTPNTTYDYLLTIEYDGQRLRLLAQLRLNRGAKATYRTADIATLLDLLQGRRQDPIPPECSADFIHLMAQQAAAAPFTPSHKQLYQFATIPNPGEITTSPEELERLWAGLKRLQLVHGIATWRDQHGLLPSWAVLDQPVKLQLQRHPKIVLRVFPEKTLQKGQQGVGYAYLKLEGERKEKVYISWRPYYEPYIQIKVGRPTADDMLFSEMDTQELRIIRQCSHCGRFIKIETSETRREHSRCLKYFNATFEPVTEKGNLVATLRPEGTNLLHRCYPNNYLDQQQTTLLWPQAEIPTVPESDDPIAKAAYQYATACWLQRYHAGSQRQELFEQIINYRRRSLEQLAERLEEFQIPAFQAAARFLEAFRTTESPLQVDRTVFLLALLLRTQAHYPDRSPRLLQEFSLKVSNLEQLLAMTHEFCPELLLWALTWVELFFVHALA